MSPAAVPITEFLDMDLLSRLPNLELQARFLVEGFMTGLHRSPLRGFNVEFKEYRNYEPGDEPRTIDWKAFARTDRLHVKVREEDTNLTAYIVIDATASMDFKSEHASLTKWIYARSLAAAMLLLLNRQRDAAGLVVYGDGGFDVIGPSRKLSEISRMFGAIDRSADGVSGSLSQTLEDLAAVAKRRSIVFILSDFYEDPEAYDAPLRRLHFGGCEPVFIHMLDPLELDFDFRDPVRLLDLETRNLLPVTPDLMRSRYLKQFEAHRQALARLARTYNGKYEVIRTDQPPYQAMGAYLARRSEAL
ncbi:MAG: DUF58 domain-containing protein [Planctomycetaceae bacterium]|nr:DUF58 domain-containing protein [Planctomycetaceae bacterium]